MPFASQHMLLQWGGSFRGTSATDPVQEIFSGSLRFQGPGIAQADDDQTLGALALVLRSFWMMTTAYIPTSAWLEQVKWNRINVDGRYASEKTRGVVVQGVKGTESAGYPHQVAWATTWQSDVVRGKASKGRTFWPTGVPIDTSTGHVNAAFTKNMAQASALLIKNLNAAARTGAFAGGPTETPLWLEALGYVKAPTGRPEAGMSASIMSKIGAGTTRVITAAGVGDRLDIQRRRANGMTDRRTVVPLDSILTP